jgi:hypothetical protein
VNRRDDDHLQRRGQPEPGQADQQRPPAGGVRLQRVVDLVGGVMAVPAEDLRQSMPQPPYQSRVVVVTVVVLVVLVVRVRVVKLLVVAVSGVLRAVFVAAHHLRVTSLA